MVMTNLMTDFLTEKKMANKILREGMWAGDLDDMVQPLITIDEYDSKIDQTAIVIGFYVNDFEAAKDLNRFVQKSPVSIIDSNVSPAPDQRGYYIVFVEISFNDRIVPNIKSIIDEISPLVNIDNWLFNTRNIDKPKVFDVEVVAKCLKINKIKDTIEEISKKIKSKTH